MSILSMSQRRTAPAMTTAINNNNRCDATENCMAFIAAEEERSLRSIVAIALSALGQLRD